MKNRQKIRIPDAAARRQAPPQAFTDALARQFSTAIGPRFAVRSAADLAEITIYDEIGFWGITAGDVRRALDDITAPRILLRVNSPGGEVFDGLAIYNDLLAHPAQIQVEITGIAASIASIIAMAGDTIAIAENGFMMIHNASTISWGNRHEMTDTAALLGQIDEAMALTYAARTGGDQADIAALMDNETWLLGAGAVEAGFADETTAGAEEEPDRKAALFDLSQFEHVPGALKRRQEDGLRAIGYSKREARAAVANGFGELPRREAAAGPARRDAAAGDEAALQGAEALVAQIRAAAGR